MTKEEQLKQEAEEYANNKVPKTLLSNLWERYFNSYLAGAESREKRKEHEWHYVKDELPNHNGQFYVALKGHTETYILNYDYDEDDESKMVWLDDDGTNFDDEVYAWHEKLKAPKEIEK